MRLTKADSTALDPRTDGELVRDAALGAGDAVEELYRRHAEAAWRVAQAVARNRDDASDAVSEAFTRVLQKVSTGRLTVDGSLRPYLMTAVRNAAIDNLRRGGRIDLTDGAQLEGRSSLPEPQERLFAGLDTALIAAAFRALPERWRSVLWLTEVEGMEPREVASVMRITPNNAAQLAARARTALRTRYLQAHLGDNVEDGCRETVDNLGAYVSGKLAARDLAAVDQHLAGCEACRDRAADLEDLGGRLRKIVLPLPLALSPKAIDALRASALSPVASNDVSGGAFWSDLATRLQKPLMATTAGLVAVGVLAIGVLTGPKLPDSRVPVASPKTSSPAVVPLPATEPIAADLSAAPKPAVARSSDGPTFLDELAAAAPVPAPPAAITPAEPASGSPVAPPSAPATPADSADRSNPLLPTIDAAPLVEVAAEVVVAPLSAALSVGIGDGSCTSLSVADTVILGCEDPAGDSPEEAPSEPAAEENHATVAVDTEVTGEQSVTVPLTAL